MASTPSLICGTYLQNCPSSTPNVPKQLCYPCFPIDEANGKANRRSKPASLPSRDPADAYKLGRLITQPEYGWVSGSKPQNCDARRCPGRDRVELGPTFGLGPAFVRCARRYVIMATRAAAWRSKGLRRARGR